MGAAMGLILSACAPSVPRELVSRPVVASAIAENRIFRPISMQAQSGRTLILLYHDIREQDPDSTIYDCTPAEFERQMTALYQEGANVVTLDDLYEHLTEGTPLPERAVVITFDDNYASVKEHATPILERYRFPYSIFAHTDFVGNKQVGREKMSWDDLRELVNSRLSKVHVGSHSASHPWRLDTATYATIRREVRASRDAIESNLGVPCTSIAWPGGHYSADAVQEAMRYGYLIGFGMGVGLAEDSPGMLQLCRYPFYKFEAGWEALKAEDRSGVRFAELPLVSYPVTAHRERVGGVLVNWVEGGRPLVTSSKTGQPLSVVRSDSNARAVAWLGRADWFPFKKRTDRTMTPGQSRLPNRVFRPLVLMDPQAIAFLPFSESQMNEEAVLRRYMPELTDLFVGECWLVNKGDALLNDALEHSGCSDVMKSRPRAFLGVKQEGATLLGVIAAGVTARKLADIAAELGCVEAVMLSSTSPGIVALPWLAGAQSGPSQLVLALSGEDAVTAPKPEEPAP